MIETGQCKRLFILNVDFEGFQESLIGIANEAGCTSMLLARGGRREGELDRARLLGSCLCKITFVAFVKVKAFILLL
jgi:hypothetical protein